MTADEDAAGALAALARLQNAGDVHAELVASGPLTDWRVRARAEASRVGTLQAESLWQFARQRRGQVRVELATKPEWRASWPVPPPAAFELQAHGNWSADGPAKLEEFRLRGGGRRLEASALRDAAGGWSVSADLRGSGAPGFGFVPLDAREAHLELAGSPHGEAMLRGSFSALDLKAAEWQSGRLDASLLLRRSDSGPEDAALEAEATSAGTRFADAALPVVGDSLALKVRGRVPADGRGLGVEELRLEGGAAVVQGTLSVEDGWSRLRWALRGDASDLSTLSSVAGTRVEGRGGFTLDGSWDPRAGTGDAALEAMGDALAAPEAWWGTLLGPKAMASVRGAGSKYAFRC